MECLILWLLKLNSSYFYQVLLADLLPSNSYVNICCYKLLPSDTKDLEAFLCAVVIVIFGICNSLKLSVSCAYKCLRNIVTNSSPVSSYTMWHVESEVWVELIWLIMVDSKHLVDILREFKAAMMTKLDYAPGWMTIKPRQKLTMRSWWP